LFNHARLKIDEELVWQKIQEKTYSIMEVKRQLKVTVPIVLAQAVGLKAGDKIKWVIDRSELVMKKA